MPRRPSGGIPGWVWVIGALVLFSLPFDLVLLAVLAVFAIAYFLLIAAIGIVVGGGYLLYRYLNREARAERQAREAGQREEAARRYQHALVYWNQLQYCHRCGGVFLPGHEWQYQTVTHSGALVAPAHAWTLAGQLADYADRAHAPEVVRLDEE